MTMQEPQRVRFHTWLLENELDADVADAILASMPPYTWHDLATKTDINRVEQSIQDLRAEFKADLKSEIGGVRADLKSEIGGVRDEIAQLRESTSVDLAQIRNSISVDLAEVRTTFGGQFDTIHTDLVAFRSDMTTQLIGLRHEIRIVLLALVGFMLTMVLAVTQGGLG